MSLLVAQITDTHLFADATQSMHGLPTVATFEAVMTAIAQIQPKPDLLLLTGDLTQDETLESYQRLRQAVDQIKIPAYWIAGNHDQDLATLEAGLTSDWILPDKDFTTGGWRFLLLNSRADQTVGGRLTEAEWSWFGDCLTEQQSQPTLIAVHHHPMAIGSPVMDEIGLEQPERFRAICQQHTQVKLVICGHIHQEFDQTQQQVRYLGTPSTGIQSKPGQPQFTLDDLPPGFRLLRLFTDGTIETEVVRVQIY